MQFDLTTRMRKALEKLRFECDYEDSRSEGDVIFILPGKLAPGVGDKTIADLEALSLIETGINKWFNEKGYRITDAGREALKQPVPPKPPRGKPRLSTLPPRLGTLKNRLG